MSSPAPSSGTPGGSQLSLLLAGSGRQLAHLRKVELRGGIALQRALVGPPSLGLRSKRPSTACVMTSALALCPFSRVRTRHEGSFRASAILGPLALTATSLESSRRTAGPLILLSTATMRWLSASKLVARDVQQARELAEGRARAYKGPGSGRIPQDVILGFWLAHVPELRLVEIQPFTSWADKWKFVGNLRSLLIAHRVPWERMAWLSKSTSRLWAAEGCRCIRQVALRRPRVRSRRVHQLAKPAGLPNGSGSGARCRQFAELWMLCLPVLDCRGPWPAHALVQRDLPLPANGSAEAPRRLLGTWHVTPREVTQVVVKISGPPVLMLVHAPLSPASPSPAKWAEVARC